MTRDHGGDLDRAVRRWGAGEWIDLSTGINPVPYPLPQIPARAWTALPTRADTDRLATAARDAYSTPAQAVPLAGAQAAIQIVPGLAPAGPARILGPTYNEHAAAARAAGREVDEVADLGALAGAALATVVSPNNPDGRHHGPRALVRLAGRVGLLVVDESFAEAGPGASLAPHLGGVPNAVVLRSFGKFYGLAGLRLGFALAAPDLADRIRERAGPWPVSGAAIHVGAAALADAAWQRRTRHRLAADAARLDALAAGAGWTIAGGTTLFRTYAAPDAAAAQDGLADHRVWSRIFPYSQRWIRLGLPPPEGWARLDAAFRDAFSGREFSAPRR